MRRRCQFSVKQLCEHIKISRRTRDIFVLFFDISQYLHSFNHSLLGHKVSPCFHLLKMSLEFPVGRRSLVQAISLPLSKSSKAVFIHSFFALKNSSFKKNWCPISLTSFQFCPIPLPLLTFVQIRSTRASQISKRYVFVMSSPLTVHELK